MGQQGLGEMNFKGERFAYLCATGNLVVGRSFFHHRRIHKATWATPHQIDHMCIAKKFHRTLQDVLVRRDADVASDHHLLIVRLTLNMRRNWKEGTNQLLRYNTTLLKDTNNREEFQVLHVQELLEGEM